MPRANAALSLWVRAKLFRENFSSNVTSNLGSLANVVIANLTVK